MQRRRSTHVCWSCFASGRRPRTPPSRPVFRSQFSPRMRPALVYVIRRVDRGLEARKVIEWAAGLRPVWRSREPSEAAPRYRGASKRHRESQDRRSARFRVRYCPVSDHGRLAPPPRHQMKTHQPSSLAIRSSVTKRLFLRWLCTDLAGHVLIIESVGNACRCVGTGGSRFNRRRRVQRRRVRRRVLCTVGQQD